MNFDYLRKWPKTEGMRNEIKTMKEDDSKQNVILGKREECFWRLEKRKRGLEFFES